MGRKLFSVALVLFAFSAERCPSRDPDPIAFIDEFDDSRVGDAYSAVGQAELRARNGFLEVRTGGPDGGVLVTFPKTIGKELLRAFCVRFGIDITQLRSIGDQFVFSVAESPASIRWEIKKTGSTSYEYKVFKDGQLKFRGVANLTATTYFRIDKKTGTDKVIGEVVFPDGTWETLWEKDPPGSETPFSQLTITSNLEVFRVDFIKAGLHTEIPTTEGAVSDLSFAPEEGVVFTPVGRDLYDIDVTTLDDAYGDSRGTTPIDLRVTVAGDAGRTVNARVQCRGGGRGDCLGFEDCGSKNCPEREYDLGDGQGFRPFSGTCGRAAIGIPACGCSYRLKKTFKGIRLAAGEFVSVAIDPEGRVPEFVESNNQAVFQPLAPAFAHPIAYACQTSAGGAAIEARLRLTSGFFDVPDLDPASVRLVSVNGDGDEAMEFPAESVRIDGRTALLDFRTGAGAGLPSCPASLYVTGALKSRPQFWEASVQPRVVTPGQVSERARAALSELEGFPLNLVDLGTPRVVPNALTGRLVAMGEAAVPTLFEALGGPNALLAAYSAYCLGQILAPSELPRLREFRSQVQARQPKQPLDYTIIGEIDAALQETVELPPGDCCCVTDTEIVATGAFQGGKKLGDYYPYLAKPNGTSDYWGGDGGTAGPFDTGSRVGVQTQIVGTMTGNRDKCSITQYFTILESNYPGAGQPYGDSAPVGVRTDDVARSGQDTTKPPFRQNIDPDKVSFADPPSNPYTPTSTYKARKSYESCFVSTPDPACKCMWDRCCVTWIRQHVLNAGAAVTTLKVVGRFCEKGP